MNTPEVNTQSKPRTAHQEVWKFKEEWKMKTATLTEQVNMLLHEHLAMKTPVKLLGGLALGALVMAATALPLGTTYADEPARPLSIEQAQCYPEDNVVCLHGSFLADVPSDPALARDTAISSVQFEEWPEAGLDSYADQRFMVEQGKLEQAKASNRLYSEQRELDFIEELEIMGIPWRIDDQGRVVVVEAPRKPTAGSPLSIEQGACYPLYPELGPCASEFVAVTPTIADRNDRGLFDEVPAAAVEDWTDFGLDSNTYHLLNQLKAGSPSVREQSQCYPELDNQCSLEVNKVGSPSSIDQRFPPGTLPEDMAATESTTLSIDQRFPPGTLPEDMAATESATLSIDQRFPPGTLPED
jgi:hypothetical protein